MRLFEDGLAMVWGLRLVRRRPEDGLRIVWRQSEDGLEMVKDSLEFRLEVVSGQSDNCLGTDCALS